MEKATFEHTTYIHGTPEDVWRGLMDPDVTSRYWFHVHDSDWIPGSEWKHRRTDHEGTVDVQGTVLEIDRPNRLVLSWATPAEPDAVSRVSFEMTAVEEWPHGPWTGLHLVHSDLDPDGQMLPSISYGWPAVLSGLKSILERPDIFDAGE